MQRLETDNRIVEFRKDLAMNSSSRFDRFTYYGILATLLVSLFSVTLKEFFLGLTILFWMLQIGRPDQSFYIPKLGWAFLFFLLSAVLSAVASEYTFQALRGVWDIASYTAFFFIVLKTAHTPERVRKIIWVLILSTALWSLAGMIHQYLILQKEFFGLLKFFSLGNKNSIGQYLQMMLSVMVGLWIGNSFDRRGRMLLLGAILPCVVALFFSSSKTMWVAFFLTLLLFAWLKKSRVVLGGVIILAGLLIIVAWLRPQVGEMGAAIVNFAHAPSMQERYLGWEKSSLMFLDNPIFGVGPKCFMEARDKYQVLAVFGQAHNMVLHVACEMGLLGVASLLGWIGVYIYFILVYRKQKKDPLFDALWLGGAGFLVTLAVGGITEPTIGGEHSLLFMTVVALLQGGLHMAEKDTSKIFQGVRTL